MIKRSRYGRWKNSLLDRLSSYHVQLYRSIYIFTVKFWRPNRKEVRKIRFTQDSPIDVTDGSGHAVGTHFLAEILQIMGNLCFFSPYTSTMILKILCLGWIMQGRCDTSGHMCWKRSIFSKFQIWSSHFQKGTKNQNTTKDIRFGIKSFKFGLDNSRRAP